MTMGFLGKYFRYSPYIAFLPFLFFYVVLVLVFKTTGNYGDESRYLQFANNLLHGFYSPPSPDVNLWNGPGYPILILPLVWLKLPLISITVVNAIVQYLSVVFLFYSVKNICSEKYAMLAGLAFGFYYPAYLWFMPLIFTESLTIFLIVLTMFFLSRTMLPESSREKWILWSGVFFGLLVLTKIVFGYVLLCLLAVVGARFMFHRSSGLKQLLFSLLIALAVNVPYLIYTHSLTGKIFYWGNSGGANFYWMTSPFAGEYGEWHGAELDEPAKQNTGIVKNHRQELEYINSFKGVERDEAFIRIGVENIKKYPGKYIRNLLANCSRLLFDTPLYFASPTDLFIFRMLPICLILPFIIISFLIFILRFKYLPRMLKLLFLMTVFYFSFSVLVSAYNRQFNIMIPIFILFISYAFYKFINVEIKSAI